MLLLLVLSIVFVISSVSFSIFCVNGGGSGGGGS